jgi:phosphoglycolate phosphatase
METKKFAVIFDMDGVLIDSIDHMAAFFIENHPGVSKAEYGDLFLGNYHEESKKFAHLEVARSEEERATRFAAYVEAKSQLPLFSGIKELLQCLHQEGVLLVLNTSTYERSCLPTLERTGVRDLFDCIAAADLSKSKEEKFKIIQKKYALTFDQMLFVTDSLGDVREADAVGVPTVAVTWGVHDADYFSREPHAALKRVVHTVAELGEYIETLK